MPEKENAELEVKQETVVVPEKKEQTISEVVEQPVIEKKEEVVPLAKYMEEKRLRKEAEDKLKLGALGTDNSSDDLKELAEKYGADPELLVELEKRFKGGSKAEIESDLKKEIEELKHNQNKDRVEKAFSGMWDNAMKDSPEYAGIANREVMKSLSLLPENRNKTFSQLLDETYGNSVKGKKTIETGHNTTTKSKDEVDFSKMDDETWETVKNNPEMMTKYNEFILKNLKL